MPQVSRPLVIALVAVVGFAGAWMTVLKKRVAGGGGSAAAPAHAAPPRAPGTAGLGRSIQHAHDAVAASQASAARSEAAAGQAPAAPPKPAAPVVAKPATPPKPAPAPAATTTVLLFAGAGADDAAARQVVRSIRAPHVRTIVASLSAVPRYAKLLGGVQVTAAPAIFVIAANRTAQQIDGLPDVEQVQAAIRALRG